MTTSVKALGILTLSALAVACSSTQTLQTKSPYKGDAFNVQCNVPQTALEGETSISGLDYVGSFIANSPFDSSAAEIVSYDGCTDKLYVVNAQSKRIDVLALSEDSKPVQKGQIDLSTAATHAGINIGAANSVSTHEGFVAVAIENAYKQANGIIALYRSDTLELITTYPAGALPDMVSFSKDGRFIASANEGEPSKDYSVDPEGSVTLVDLKRGPYQAKVTQIDFKDFNDKRKHELNKHVRISGPNATAAQDFEPEYLSFGDNGKIYVALQENNALAIVDVFKKDVTKIQGLGEKSWSYSKLDASNKDKKAGHFSTYSQLVGLYMPDSLATFTINDTTYIATANEGDGREYGYKTTQKECDKAGFTWDEDDYAGTVDYATKSGTCLSHIDEVRGKKLDIDSDHALANALKDKTALARLKVVKPNHTLSASENVQAYGSRSFSIWDEHGELVYDSGDEFAQIVQVAQADYFNSSNDSNQSTDDRSDDKGAEPEALEVATINGRTYAFIGLERQGGIMTYDVTNPKDAQFLNYTNRRNFEEDVCTRVNDDGECTNETYNPAAGDLGPESIEYFSRNGDHFIAVGNEVSGTTSVFRIKL